jgi:hypothetical protein
MSTALNTNYLKNGKIAQPVYIAAVSAATLAALKAIEVKASPAQTQTMIKQAIYISVGVQTQPAVKQITQTAQQIATQQAVKAGLQVQTQQAIKEATKEATQTQTADQTQTKDQTKVQEKVQTKEQTQTKVATQEATQTATNEATNENENEAENESENELALPKHKKKSVEEQSEPTEDMIKNATTYKAGFGWWLRFPNGQWKFYKKLPAGATAVGTGKGSGKRSVQTLQGEPIRETHKMGFETVKINLPAHQPGKAGAISYAANPKGRPGMSMTRDGEMVHIKGVGTANRKRMPKGRILY